jgi:hypothetical protein
MKVDTVVQAVGSQVDKGGSSKYKYKINITPDRSNNPGSLCTSGIFIPIMKMTTIDYNANSIKRGGHTAKAIQHPKNQKHTNEN